MGQTAGGRQIWRKLRSTTAFSPRWDEERRGESRPDSGRHPSDRTVTAIVGGTVCFVAIAFVIAVTRGEGTSVVGSPWRAALWSGLGSIALAWWLTLDTVGDRARSIVTARVCAITGLSAWARLWAQSPTAFAAISLPICGLLLAGSGRSFDIRARFAWPTTEPQARPMAASQAQPPARFAFDRIVLPLPFLLGAVRELWAHGATNRAWVWLAVAVIAACVARYVPLAAQRVRDAVNAAARHAGSVLSILTFAVLGAVTLGLGWFATIATHLLDAVTFRRSRRQPFQRSGWQRGTTLRHIPTETLRSAGRSNSDGATANRVKGSGRTKLAVFATLLIVGATIGVSRLRDAVQPPREMMDAPAMASSRWWPELSRAQTVVASVTQSRSWDVEALPYRLRSPYLNIDKRHRASWSPPQTSCRRVTIWALGGSTMFGYGQRDDHTIPSELAKRLFDSGMAADVTNFGVPGDTLWIQTRKLEQALATTDDRPDLVIFYDGVNEWGSQSALAQVDRAGDPTFAAFEDSGMFNSFRRAQEVLNKWLIPNDNIWTQTDDPAAKKRSAETATADQYRMSVDSSRRLLDDFDIAGVWFLQPIRATRAKPVAGESSRFESLEEPTTVAGFDAMAAATRGTVVDLRGAMDGSDEPIYYDGVHTNERGASLVAEAMVPAVIEALEADMPQHSASTSGSTSCSTVPQ